MAGNDEYTSLLIHSDTTGGSTTFEDSGVGGSGTPHTLSKDGTGTLEHSTTKHKFGASSIKLYTSYPQLGIKTDEHADFAPDGDFTIDFWLLLPSSQAYQLKLTALDSSSSGIVAYIVYDSDSSSVVLIFSIYTSGEMTYYAYLGQVNSVSTDTWHHVLFQRNGANLEYAWNGVFITPLMAEQPGANTNPASSAVFKTIIPEDNAGTIYLDEVRFSSGIARETSGNFTPPSASYFEEVVIDFTPAGTQHQQTNGKPDLIHHIFEPGDSVHSNTATLPDLELQRFDPYDTEHRHISGALTMDLYLPAHHTLHPHLCSPVQLSGHISPIQTNLVHTAATPDMQSQIDPHSSTLPVIDRFIEAVGGPFISIWVPGDATLKMLVEPPRLVGTLWTRISPARQEWTLQSID